MQGYITSYFPLHVSSFYGQLIRPDAMTYIMRNVDTGTADPDYPLDPKDVEAIIADQGEGVLNERSMRNVCVLDHLLSSDPDAAETLIRTLPGDGKEGISFISRYLSTGQRRNAFVAALTRQWPSVFDYLAADAPLSPEERARFFSVALGHRGKRPFSLNNAVRAFLMKHVAHISALTGPNTVEDAAHAIRFVVDSGAVLPDATALSQGARRAIGSTRAYELTAENLVAVSGSTIFALDALRDVDDEIYAYAIDEHEKYFLALDAIDDPGPTIQQASAFVQILRDAGGWPADELTRLVRDAAAGCRVAALSEVPSSTWPAIVTDRRTHASFANVRDYLREYASLDAPLAALLQDVNELAGAESAAEEERSWVSLQIINADTELLPDLQRVNLANSTEVALPSVASVAPRSGELIGLLIEARLIRDDEDAFSPRLMVDWFTQKSAIIRSAHFGDFVGPETLEPAHIGSLMRSDEMPNAVLAAVIDRLDEFGPLPLDAHEGIAWAAVQRRVVLTSAQVRRVVHAGSLSNWL
ncbi:hypothetical protein CMsap09_13085 [Clavibacter michiganensis]|uniref:Uncharacterized protein n=1 Tax=Clavibacter michiganensis TaxID=28447 RepID=A0A251XWN2_9MICO|nr:hypothetical protein CMsap09_13085 [Clavibacter michiganensis]